jgi:hypothetical protein
MPATTAATAVPSTKKKVGGAVASHGFVLDSKGNLQPHEVHVPFAPPARYHKFSTVVTPATQDVRTMDISKQGVKKSLHQSIEEYKKACDSDETFRRQHIGLTTLTEQLKHDATNAVLLAQLKEQEASCQQPPLYHQGSKLAQEAQKLRDDELEKATNIILSKSEMKLGMGSKKLKQRELHRQEAAAIREAFLQPVRAHLNRTSTPPRVRRTGEFVLGVGESAVDTAKFAVDLLGLAGKLLGGAAHSIVTWENKLGIGEEITDTSALIDTLCKQTKYEWENPAEYQARLKATQSYRKELECTEKALNAETYHNRKNRNHRLWEWGSAPGSFWSRNYQRDRTGC